MQVKFGHLERAAEIIAAMTQKQVKNHLLRLQLRESKRSIEGPYQSFVDTRNELISEHKGEGAEGITPEDAGWEAFRVEYEALLNADTEFQPKVLPDMIFDLFELSLDEYEVLEICGFVNVPSEIEASA